MASCRTTRPLRMFRVTFCSSRRSAPPLSLALFNLLLDNESIKIACSINQAAAQHQIDVTVISDIECEAQYLAASVDSLTENLDNLLHSISALTADNVEVYRASVTQLTDAMDANIKSMYTIMAKAEEITNLMRPAEQLAARM